MNTSETDNQDIQNTSFPQLPPPQPPGAANVESSAGPSEPPRQPQSAAPEPSTGQSEPEMLDAKTIGKKLGITRHVVYHLIRDGELPAIDISRSPGKTKPIYRIPSVDFESFLEERRVARDPIGNMVIPPRPSEPEPDPDSIVDWYNDETRQMEKITVRERDRRMKIWADEFWKMCELTK